MSRDPIPTWCYALVVVRLGRRFLVVQEARRGLGWYLPAGRVELGETFAETAVRETLEEAGVDVTLDGVIRVEHRLMPNGAARLRVLFVAHPKSDTPPKKTADKHSLQARYVTLDELAGLSLRHPEVAEILDYVDRGGAIYPLTVLAREGAPMGAVE